MKKFTYAGIPRLGVYFTRVGGVATLLLATLVAGGMLILMVRENAVFFCGILLVIWTLLLGWLIGLTLINVFPTVWVEDKGLTISVFLVGRAVVLWTEIIDVGAGHIPFGNVLVRARRITPFHRVYGLLYSRSWYPGFVIGQNIQDRDVLVREIRQRVPVKVNR